MVMVETYSRSKARKAAVKAASQKDYSRPVALWKLLRYFLLLRLQIQVSMFGNLFRDVADNHSRLNLLRQMKVYMGPRALSSQKELDSNDESVMSSCH